MYDLGVARGVFTADGRSYYGRDVSVEKFPDLASDAVLEAAEKIGPGEAAMRGASSHLGCRAVDGGAIHSPNGAVR